MLSQTTLTGIEEIAIKPGYNYDITISNGTVAGGDVLYFFGQGQYYTNSVRFDGSQELDGRLGLYGGDGSDVLIGGNGSDYISGGRGADMLTGGGGVDVFHYDNAAQSSGLAYDSITDFTYGEDVIQIAGEVHDSFTSVTTGTLDRATFDADLQAAVGSQLHAGSAVYFTPDSGGFVGQTFLVVDEGGDGYTPGVDYVIHLPGPPPTPGVDIVVA